MTSPETLERRRERFENAAREHNAVAELQRHGLRVEPHPEGGVLILGNGWSARARTARQFLEGGK